MANERAKRRHLVNILTLEHRLRDLALATYKEWLPAAHAAVIPAAFTAASVFDDPLPPNPDGILSTQKDWDAALDKVFIHGLGQIMGNQVVAYVGATGVTPPAEEFRSAYLNDVRNRMVKTPDSVWGEISRDLADGIDKGETPEELRARVNAHLDANNLHLYKNRADNVARTEAAGAYNGSRYQAALLEAAAHGDVLDAVWLSTIDGRTRKTHVAADGQRVGIGTPFRVGGHSLRWPGDPRGPAKEVCRCRCSISFLDREDPLPDETDRQTERGAGNSTVKNRNGLSQEQQIALWRQQGILRARDDPDGIGRIDEPKKASASIVPGSARGVAKDVKTERKAAPSDVAQAYPSVLGVGGDVPFTPQNRPDVEDRIDHILDGDKPGEGDSTGHRFGKGPAEIQFPDWSDDEVAAAIDLTLADPASVTRKGAALYFRRIVNGAPIEVRTKARGGKPKIFTAASPKDDFERASDEQKRLLWGV